VKFISYRKSVKSHSQRLNERLIFFIAYYPKQRRMMIFKIIIIIIIMYVYSTLKNEIRMYYQ
jgi:hypothetical protein